MLVVERSLIAMRRLCVILLLIERGNWAPSESETTTNGGRVIADVRYLIQLYTRRRLMLLCDMVSLMEQRI